MIFLLWELAIKMFYSTNILICYQYAWFELLKQGTPVKICCSIPNSKFLFQEENDNNYEEEPEVADEFDSDFDDDVSYLLLKI